MSEAPADRSEATPAALAALSDPTTGADLFGAPAGVEAAKQIADAATGNRVRSLGERIVELEALLHDQWDLLIGIIDSLEDGVFAKDLEGRYTLVNQADALGFNRSPERIIGLTDHSLFQVSEANRLREIDRRIIETGESQTYELNGITAGGEPSIYFVFKFPRHDRGGMISGVMGVARNITDLRKTEEELARYRDHLDELVEERAKEIETSNRLALRSNRLASLGSLADGLSHEIRGPIASIIAKAEEIQAREGVIGKGSEVQHCLSSILRDARKCDSIVEGISRFAGSKGETPVTCDLVPVVERTRRKLMTEAGKLNGSIHLELDRDVPHLRIVPDEIEQALTCVVRNALQSRFEGARVVIRTASCDEGVRITVRDNGPGISDLDNRHMFDPFYSSRHKVGSIGLGLSLAHGIVRSHGGTVDVEGRLGEGTVVTIVLPK